MNALPYVMTDRALTVYKDGAPMTYSANQPGWERAMELLIAGEWEQLVAHITPMDAIRAYAATSDGLVTTRDGGVFLGCERLDDNDLVVQKILHFAEKGLPISPLCRFLEKLYKNPSFRIRRDLMTFLEYGQLPITEDGDFLAYKRVRDNFTDVYSGKVDYTPGRTVEMARIAVDDDPSRTCSSGLHACSFDYLRGFYGARCITVRINPEDVVSIPADYNNTKLRAARLISVEEIEAPTENVLAGDVAYEDDCADHADDGYDEHSYSVYDHCVVCYGPCRKA